MILPNLGRLTAYFCHVYKDVHFIRSAHNEPKLNKLLIIIYQKHRVNIC